MNISAEGNYFQADPRFYYAQAQSNQGNTRNEQMNVSARQSFIPQNVQSQSNYLNSMPRNGTNMPFEQNSGYLQPIQNTHIGYAQPRQTFLRRLRCIPIFNGDSFAQLKEFIEVTESLYISCINEGEENELYEQILLQVRGEARNLVMSLENPEWESIKNRLLTHFSYLANKDILTSKLENARQEDYESINAFADRIRNLLRDKMATYSYMTEDQKSEYIRLARRSFSRGLSNIKLRNHLITRGASSLEDAIAFAIEAENDDINYIRPKDLFCRKCKQNGHRQKECGGQNSIMGKLISAIRSLNKQSWHNFANHKNDFMNNNYENDVNSKDSYEYDSKNYSQLDSNQEQYLFYDDPPDSHGNYDIDEQQSIADFDEQQFTVDNIDERQFNIADVDEQQFDVDSQTENINSENSIGWNI